MAQGNQAQAMKSYQARQEVISRLAKSVPGKEDLPRAYRRLLQALS